MGNVREEKKGRKSGIEWRYGMRKGEAEESKIKREREERREGANKGERQREKKGRREIGEK